MPTDLTTLQLEALTQRGEGTDLSTLQLEVLTQRGAGIDLATLQFEVLVDDREFDLAGLAAAVEAQPGDRAVLSGQVAAVEASPPGEARLAGQAAAIEASPSPEGRMTGLLAVVEGVPFVFIPVSDRETTGRELSGESMISDRRFTGQRRKKRRGY